MALIPKPRDCRLDWHQAYSIAVLGTHAWASALRLVAVGSSCTLQLQQCCLLRSTPAPATPITFSRSTQALRLTFTLPFPPSLRPSLIWHGGPYQKLDALVGSLQHEGTRSRSRLRRSSKPCLQGLCCPCCLEPPFLSACTWHLLVPCRYTSLQPAVPLWTPWQLHQPENFLDYF
jgi:hypothetical protein